MQGLWNFVVDCVGYFFIVATACHFLLRWERQVLNHALGQIVMKVKGLSDDEAEAFLCRPDINRLLKIIEIREGVPKDEQYHRRIVAQRAINQAMSGAEEE